MTLFPCGDGTNRGEVPAPPSLITPVPPDVEPPEFGCLGHVGGEEILVGNDLYIIFTADGQLLAFSNECDIECFLNATRNEDTILFLTEGGEITSDPEQAIRAVSGGEGGLGQHPGGGGSNGGSGGGGGAASPSVTGTPTSGGGAVTGQGFPGGAGRMILGVQHIRSAASGGGGGPGGPGGDGVASLEGARGGSPGPGRFYPDWGVFAPGGGRGVGVRVEDFESTGSLRGGHGAGGALVQSNLSFPVGELVDLQVARVAIFKARVIENAAQWAVLTGGTVVERFGWRYHIFTADGVLGVSSPGFAEGLIASGGSGGGDDVGEGGGAGGVRANVALNIEEPQDIVVGSGGSAGQLGEESSIGELATASQGGSGNGGRTGLPGQSGLITQGQDGGDGGGYTDALDEDIDYAGGGGGASEAGKEGATEVGADFEDNWDVQGSEELDVDSREGELHLRGNTRLTNLAMEERGEMMVQCLLRNTDEGGQNSNPGIHARWVRNNGGSSGYAIHVRGIGINNAGLYRWNNHTSFAGLSSGDRLVTGTNIATDVEYFAQLYVADDLQQAWVGLPNAGSSLWSGQATNNAHNGQNERRAGLSHFVFSGLQNGFFREFLVFPSKFITIESAPSGWSAEVLNEDGVVVVTASESGGEINLDCSRFGGATEDVPSDGWDKIRVIDDSSEVVVETEIAAYPGKVYEWDGSELVLVTNATPLVYDDFKGFIPGPELGDGGTGLEVDPDFLVPEGKVVEDLSATAHTVLSVDEIDVATNLDILGMVRMDNDESAVRARMMARVADPNTGYLLQLGGSDGALSMWRRVGGTFAQLGSSFGSWDPDTDYFIRFNLAGTTLRGKFWEVGTAEPDWQITQTDSNISAAGFAGIGASNGSIGTFFSALSISLDGPAPLPWEDPGDAFVTNFAEFENGEIPEGFTGRWGAAEWVVKDFTQLDWLDGVIASDEGFIAGGGGAGSESIVAGAGGKGGGGDGNFDGAGSAGSIVGAGGGGGSPGQNGGAGGNGVVVLRTRVA